MQALSTVGVFTNMKADEESQVLMGPPRIQALPNATANPLAWDFAPAADLFKRLRLAMNNVVRETCFIDSLSSASELLAAAAEKLRIECYRVGAIDRAVEIKMPAPASVSVNYTITQIALGMQIYANLSYSLRLFIDKYSNEPFDIIKFINMNRVAKAERLFLQVQETLQQTLRDYYMVKFHTMGQVHVCAVKFRQIVRGSTMQYKKPVYRPVKVEKRKPKIDISSPEESFAIPKGIELTPMPWPISPIHSLEMSTEQLTIMSGFNS
mmetsp:Transcript_7686/g.14546  ORF Transcript_7686/g.14546 Transcript_7686/m.14546 type:complete len:267 (-) Transcript_7686:759-1559(-)